MKNRLNLFKKTFLPSAAAATLAALIPSYALAVGDPEVNHSLSIGGGISSPSITSALVENPAGLGHNRRFNLLASAVSDDDDHDHVGLGGHLYLGNGSIGAGLGLQNYSTTGGRTDHKIFNYGAGLIVDPLDIAIGAAAATRLGDSSTAAFSTNVGALFNPRGTTRLGFTAFDINHQFNQWGAGIASDIDPAATFAVDFSTNKGRRAKTIKPSLGIHLADLQLVAGYGIKLDDDAGSWIRRGSSFGIGLKLTRNALLQAYYNQLSLFYAALRLEL